MRVTHSMLASTTLRNLNQNRERLDRLQDQLTSGQRISTPSDDPIGTASALEFRGTISELQQYIRNVDAATSWLETTDASLEYGTKILHRARELAVQGASDALSQADRQAMAVEVSDLLEQAVSLGNTTYAGQYVFAGLRVGTAPFSTAGTPPTSVTYNGDGGSINRQINSQSTVTVNTHGDTALGFTFTSLIGLRDALNSGNTLTVSQRIADIDGALDSVISARAQVGARLNRLTSERDRLESFKLDIAGLLSKIQDVDMTEAISEFVVQQNVYQAALAAGAKAIQPSLLDYLG